MPLEATGVAGGRGPLDDPAVDELPGEAHAHPGAGAGGLRQRFGDDVVEGAVEVREGDVDDDARHRVDLRGTGRRLGLGAPDLGRDESELLSGVG